jgi:hypothetical protein
VLVSSGLAMAGLLSGVAIAGTSDREAARARARERVGLPRDAGQFRERMERLRNAHSEEERQEILRELAAQRAEQILERLKVRLGVSDAEWPVVKPRLKAVYDRVRGSGPASVESSAAGIEVQTRRKELSEVLHDEQSTVEQIKPKLTALRAAQEKARQELAAARQDLRRLLTVRQEALLVLDELLV